MLIALAGVGAYLARGGHEGLAYLLGLPFSNYLATAFYVDNSRYGESKFAFGGSASGFCKLYGMTFLVGLVAEVYHGPRSGPLAITYKIWRLLPQMT